MSDGGKISKNEYIKQRTRELYLSLPQEKEARKARHDIRDEIIELNYAFFGYVASHTFINNSSIDYEDKFQSALLHFTEIWWWYLWKGDETHKGYRQDLSFTVFFKPRIGEMIERELNEVKYSIRRSLCMEVGKQIGKHWGKVTYEDLSDPRVKLSPEKMTTLQAIFGTLYTADLEDHILYMEAPHDVDTDGILGPLVFDNYSDLRELLIQEMIRLEHKITEKDLRDMSNVYGIDIDELKENVEAAEIELRRRLLERIDLQDNF